MYEGGEQKRKEISRREFLRIGTMSALGFLIEIGIPKKVRAELEEFLKERPFINANFEEGIEILRRESSTNKLERYWIYVEKGEKRGWIDVASKATGERVVSIVLNSLLEDADITLLRFAHTHPKALYGEILPEKLRVTEAARLGKVPLPPSPHDILEGFWLRKRAREKRTSYQMPFSVIDPSGIWEYDFDSGHDEIGRIVAQNQDDETGPLVLFQLSYLKRQDRFYETGSTEEGVKELQEWALREYGIILRYAPWSSAASN